MLHRLQDYYDYTLTMLGDSSITVELVEQDLKQATIFALETYNKYRPKIGYKTINVGSNQAEIKLKYEESFRGIIDVIFTETAGIVVTPFPREYYPWTGLTAVRANTIAEWYSYQDGFRGIVGTKSRWYYNKDSRVLKLLNTTPGTIKYIFAQDRYLFKTRFDINGTALSVLITDGYRRLYNVQPESLFVILPDGTLGINDADGNITTASGTLLGQYDDNTSTLVLNLSSAQTGSVLVEVNEIRSSDYHWFCRYLLGQLANVLVSKRTRFGGAVSSVDIGNVALDTEVLNRYKDELADLEDEASRWMLDWALPMAK